MLAALLHGKVSRSVDGYEDMMTSVVFGALQHLPIDLGLRPMLARLAGDPQPPWFGDITAVHVDYWPWWDEVEDHRGAEPDVALTVQLREGRPRLIIVEAKRRSGKHGHGEHDQLATQVHNGRRIAEQRGADLGGLIYLTAHLAIPEHDLAASRRALREAAAPLWWLSWRDLTPLLRTAASAVEDQPLLASVTRDAAAVLARWGMERFTGWSELRSCPPYAFTVDLGVGPVLPVPTWTFDPRRP